ncbi:Protein of unknown function, DUF599 [Melia azedarach]|uniref:Uncharacterized protein n=1 Tax=Melia azedarach TaxID=155640 RepID=A0ACC1WWF4_MELAZ|nr:Protein of unknown function, DUF599 [Melia azedarach]
MIFQKEYLDLVLVPLGLLIMLSYHLFLLYRYFQHPHTTALGFENNDKRAWVERVMQAEKKDISVALAVLSSNISAATFLSSVSLTLSSLIGAWLGSSSNNIFESKLIWGDTRASTISVKYISLLSCFLLAFSCFVQSTRHYVHSNYLISMPDSNIPIKYVEMAVIKGGDFWSLGLRALYFALNLLLWFFGPIPMFLSSIFIVIILYYLDTNKLPLHRYTAPESPTGKRAGDIISGKATFIDQHQRECGLRFDLKL